MTEQKALAYVNMYGVLGTLENLCDMDGKAKEILESLKKPVAVCFDVKGGPCCTFNFSKDGCKMTEGSADCNCKMNFSSPEKFNTMINEGKPGLPVRGITTLLGFLTGGFTKLTDRLTVLLKPSDENLKDPKFFEESTLLTLYTIAGAISALANNDSISKISAGNTVDGEISLGIKDSVHITVAVKDHRFTTLKRKSENPRAVMEFATLELANGLFAGKVSTINEMCKGNIHLAGMLSMVDNVNRILDRVAVYLG